MKTFHILVSTAIYFDHWRSSFVGATQSDLQKQIEQNSKSIPILRKDKDEGSNNVNKSIWNKSNSNIKKEAASKQKNTLRGGKEHTQNNINKERHEIENRKLEDTVDLVVDAVVSVITFIAAVAAGVDEELYDDACWNSTLDDDYGVIWNDDWTGDDDEFMSGDDDESCGTGPTNYNSIMVPNAYCQYYEDSNSRFLRLDTYNNEQAYCSDEYRFDMFELPWQSCIDDGPQTCMGVMWNACKAECQTSDISDLGYWKLVEANQEIGNAENPNDTCESGMGHWHVYLVSYCKRIQVKGTSEFMYVDGEGGDLYTGEGDNDDYSKFTFEHQIDGSVRMSVEANGDYLRQNTYGDYQLSTSYQGEDDYGRFFLEHQEDDGSFKIRVKDDGKYWHKVDDYSNAISALYQPDEDRQRFFLTSCEPAGCYRIRVKATNKFLHLDGGGDGKLSTRWQDDDDFSRFIFEEEGDGSVLLKVKANNDYLIDESGNGNYVISTRFQDDNDFRRFFIEDQSDDGSVKIKVKANGRYLFEDGENTELVYSFFTPEDGLQTFNLVSC